MSPLEYSLYSETTCKMQEKQSSELMFLMMNIVKLAITKYNGKDYPLSLSLPIPPSPSISLHLSLSLLHCAILLHLNHQKGFLNNFQFSQHFR